ncbi:MAG: TetR/AcrR family transcriptional regulator [Oscillochloris sp.]|nr:TetR/AcrR family transcriptional regulator [Oscillochloris sp.]
MPRPDVSEARRHQIIAAALRVFQRKGYHSATMPEIAAEAGLSVGGMYWYFKSKDAVVAAVLSQIFEADLEALAIALAADQPAGERLIRFAEHFAAVFDQHQWSLAVGADLYSAAAHDPHVGTFVRRYLSRYREALIGLIAQGIARNEFRSVDPAVAANAFLALEEGLALLLLVDPDQVRWKESLLLGTQLFVDGLRRIA